MTDLVVTVAKGRWQEGQDLSAIDLRIGHRWPLIMPGERVYVVADGSLRGYSTLVRVESIARDGATNAIRLVREGGVACTIGQQIQGTGAYRYRWWPRSDEIRQEDG